MRTLFAVVISIVVAGSASAQDLYTVSGVDAQPVMAQALRLNDALTFLGSKLKDDDVAKLKALADAAPSDETTQQVQAILDPYCIAMVHINPEMRVKVLQGPAERVLMQHGWKSFLVKVHNEAGTRAELVPASINADPLLHRSSGAPEPKESNLLTPGQVAQRFLEIKMYHRRPMNALLSGLQLEYAIIDIYTKDVGQREAKLGFNIGQGTQDLGFRDHLDLLFDCKPAVKVKLRVKDFDGKPAMASFVFSDNVERIAEEADYAGSIKPDYRLQMAGSVPPGGMLTKTQNFTGIYPLPSRRNAELDEYPDFFFQPQIYRADGETVTLPPGTYSVEYTRGPEYLPQSKTITVPEGVTEHEESFKLDRWIHLAKLGWYSADHHVHGGGCSHYESPSAGVNPEAMFRQGLGEDLNVSCVLSWGPCWYHQKTFFNASIDPLSTPTNVMRYDVEVSGFPSSHAGHLCLLRLKEDDYKGTTKIEEWPSWTMPVLQWGQEQGAVVGYSHSGWGLEPLEPTTELPNYVMAKFDGIGANEYIVTGPLGACDFISAGDTPYLWELNIWYHTLNTGVTTRISGETDFPCIYDERVGIARSYAPMKGKLDFDAYVEKIKLGENYVCDGKSHILDFRADGVTMGQKGSALKLAAAKKVKVSARVAAYLPEQQDKTGMTLSERQQGSPYWHIEKARIGTTRTVPVELLVNGKPIAREVIEADGKLRKVSFEVPIEYSSWIAVRVLPSSHTNPIFVTVGNKPIRASKKSAEWCRAAVDQCWKMKESQIREAERPAAKAAYDQARAYYDKAIAETAGE